MRTNSEAATRKCVNCKCQNTIEVKWRRRTAGHPPGGNKGTDSLDFTGDLF